MPRRMPSTASASEGLRRIAGGVGPEKRKELKKMVGGLAIPSLTNDKRFLSTGGEGQARSVEGEYNGAFAAAGGYQINGNFVILAFCQKV